MAKTSNNWTEEQITIVLYEYYRNSFEYSFLMSQKMLTFANEI